MELYPIKTEADHQAALKEIESLFDALPNTPEHDRLDLLSTLVETYEKVHHPIEAPEPSQGVHTIRSRGEIALTFWAQSDSVMAKPSKGIAVLPNDL
jgi:HTH-type transcriptional regulator / antitoxin HigA